MASTDSKRGLSCKVALGSNKILGIGDWKIDNMSIDELDNTEFGDDWEQIKGGLKRGGGFSFSGLFKPNNTQGQDELRTALENRTHLTDLRFYIDDTSYYAPHQTTPASYALITSAPVSASRGDLMKCEFSGRISGKWYLN